MATTVTDWMALKGHPAAEVFPLLPPDELEALAADIGAYGLLHPIVLHDGQILDGRNRLKACELAGVEPRFVEWDGDGSPWDYVWSENVVRRHMEASQRAAVRLLCVEGTEEWEANQPTLGRPADKESNVRLFNGPSPEPRKKQLAKAADVSPATAQNVLSLRKSDPERFDQVARGEKSVGEAMREMRREAKAARKEVPEDCSARRVVHHADIKAAPVAAESVDWIITDPPYPKEFLPLYADLGAFAAQALKPGGGLLAMVGQSYLPQIVAALSEHLDYHWTLAYLTPGGKATQLWDRKVNTFWKPLLWFSKDEQELPDWIGDVCKSDPNDRDKRFHEWGQTISGMRDVVERMTYPDEVICDPFCGAGTTGVVCATLGRHFVGIDVDEEAVARTKERLGL